MARDADCRAGDTLSTLTVRHPLFGRLPCYYRPLILIISTITLFSIFWFTSRYPQLMLKAAHAGQAVPSMAFRGEAIHVDAYHPLWKQILFSAINWLDSMKIGMSFGVLLGALLHTALRYYPLKVGSNTYLNSLKGALVGMPAGVCANCAVLTACGITRGNGRVELALGFLFSSPNFNPVVVVITFTALPLGMTVTKYVLLVAIILGIVPWIINKLEGRQPFKPRIADDLGMVCVIPLSSPDCNEPFSQVRRSWRAITRKNVWMLAKLTIKMMLLASVLAALLLVLVPWTELLATVTPLKLAVISVISVFMPVPIALDVLFAAQLYQQGIASGYVMLFAMTLGTFSILPAVYLWREVSKPLAAILFAMFVCIGMTVGLVFNR